LSSHAVIASSEASISFGMNEAIFGLTPLDAKAFDVVAVVAHSNLSLS